MPRPRKSLESLDATPYYYCTSRCVRRAFLCGEDRFSGRSYEHRRQWIEDRLLHLAGIFAIDGAAYAVMSNRYHTVLHLNVPRVQTWSDREIIERWHRLFKGRTRIILQEIHQKSIFCFPWSMAALFFVISRLNQVLNA